MGEMHGITVSGLINKLSAAGVSTDAPDDLANQHAKIAEEAIAGWEKAETEATVLKQRLEALAKQNSTLEDRADNLDGALKEAVNKVRQVNVEQEQKIQEAVFKEMQVWESSKTKLVNQVLQLQSEIDSYRVEASGMIHKLEFLEEENSALKLELMSKSEELEIRTIERDLSAEAAEYTSKHNLESIKKIARLEAECRRLRSVAHTSLPVSDQKSGASSSFYSDSLTDSQSDNGERPQSANTDFQDNRISKSTECQTSYSSSHPSSLIAGGNQSKSTSMLNKTGAGPGIEMNLMDDFLEIERLVALPEIVNKHCNEPGMLCNNQYQCSIDESSLEEACRRASKLEEKIDVIEAEKAELEDNLEKMKQQKLEFEDRLKSVLEANNALEEKVTWIQVEKSELEIALTKSQHRTSLLTAQLSEAELKLNEALKELDAAYESQESYKSQVIGYELEAKIMSSRIESIESELKTEKDVSAELAAKCGDLEDHLFRTKQELELLQSTISSSELKIKQDDLVAAAGKLAECQQTIASLGVQLKSLASLDDFLTDTANMQESVERLDSDNGQLYMREYDQSNKAVKSRSPCRTNDDPLASASSTSSEAQVSKEKSRNEYTKMFSRSYRGRV
uniref:Filament-like plant protein n=1 Tax=Kalanchoe fedtschenkoi TaxID=63787 RepID=A0A7N0ZUU7_KALFE